MTEQQVRVLFQPTGRTVFALRGSKLLEAAGRAGLTLETPCGGGGTCGKCRVQISGDLLSPSHEEQNIFSQAQLAEGWRLACQTTVVGEITVTLPRSSLFARQQIVTDAADADQAEVLPAVRKVYVELPPPSLADSDADLMRLENALGEFHADLDTIRRVSKRLRESHWKATAVLTDHTLIDLEAGDTTCCSYGVAVDIGTTTLAASLLDLADGQELAITSRINPQVSMGDDVLSRIQYARTPEALEKLRTCIVSAIQEMIDELCAKANVSAEYIYEVSFAGNTTMQHLLCGLDVTPLGQVPFTAAHERGLMLEASDLGLRICPKGRAYLFPLIGGFVGGDTVAGMVVTRLAESDGPVLLIDIGTNGEIVLANQGEILAASTAAGPAFEGARIACGMRATEGAIEKVQFTDSDVEFGVIGNVTPAGLCGSALIDAAAGLLDAGIVTPEGRLLPPAELPEALSEKLKRRVELDEKNQSLFVLAEGKNRIVITQRDLRELQLATGAIRAGVNILLSRAGVSASDLQRVLIAGGFGSFIRRNHAQRIGLLPGGIGHERIHYVGNASLGGAKWALLSTRARKTSERLARATEHVQLSEDLNFQMEFAEAMIFPEN